MSPKNLFFSISRLEYFVLSTEYSGWQAILLTSLSLPCHCSLNLSFSLSLSLPTHLSPSSSSLSTATQLTGDWLISTGQPLYRRSLSKSLRDHSGLRQEFCLSYFSCFCDQIPDRSNFRDKGFILGGNFSVIHYGRDSMMVPRTMHGYCIGIRRQIRKKFLLNRNF